MSTTKQRTNTPRNVVSTSTCHEHEFSLGWELPNATQHKHKRDGEPTPNSGWAYHLPTASVLCTVFLQCSCTHPLAFHLMTLPCLCIKAQTQKHNTHWTHFAACISFKEANFTCVASEFLFHFLHPDTVTLCSDAIRWTKGAGPR